MHGPACALALLLCLLQPCAGYVRMPRVLFALIGRDISTELPYVLHNIKRLSVHFPISHVLLVENNSVDETVEVFTAAFANRSEVAGSLLTGSILPFQSTGGRKNLGVLAAARNHALNALRRDFLWAELFIVVDTDLCIPWDVEEHAHVLRALHDEPWDALFANGICGVYLPDGKETGRCVSKPPNLSDDF